MTYRTLKSTLIASAAAIMAVTATVAAPAIANETATEYVAPTAVVAHKTIEIDGLTIYYREAGDPSRPTVVLLHGFPTSSVMFRNLIPDLAERYHVIAPDYPGFGGSDAPSTDQFNYTFDTLTNVVETFLEAKSVGNFTAYVMDYGAPVGYRLFERNPERIDGFIIQNGNAYEEGLEDFWNPVRALWNDPSQEKRDALREFLKIDATEWQYTHGQPSPELIAPDAWRADQLLLDRPGNQDVQLNLFYDYRTNVERYAAWQSLFREHQPPALVVWGAHDAIFPEAGAHPYKRDLQNLEFHLLDGGHFVLESHGAFISEEIIDFLDREVD